MTRPHPKSAPRRSLAVRMVRVAALGVAALWLGSTAFVTVANDQQAVVERYGQPVRDLLPGLHLKLPWPFESVRRAPSAQSSLQMPIGFRLVDEAAGLAPPPRMTRWLTGDSNIVELRANLLYRVVNARAWLYGASELHLSDPSITEEAWERPEFALRRLGEAAFTELLSRSDVDDVLTGGATALGREVLALVQERADLLGLGVEIATVQLVRRDPLASVAANFRSVQDAEAEAERTRQRNLAGKNQRLSDARINASSLVAQARQEADRLVQDARGRADRFLALATEIGDPESVAGRGLRIDALRKLVEGGTLRVVQPGTADQPTVWIERSR